MNTIEQTERLKNLSPAKRALLMKSLQKNAIQSQETQTIPRRERQSGIPLSFAQQRLWLIDRLESGTVAYNVPFAVRLKGSLNPAAFERSINEVIKRHEALRTTFTLEGDQPIQIIASHASLTVSLLDLKQVPADEKEAHVQRLAADEAQTRFDLSKGPLLRTTLLQLDQDEHVALFTMHHIVSDGWSDSVLIEEIVRFYEADLAGQRAALPELPIQYADFALWQRERLQGAVLDELLSYWKQQLAGAPPLLNLPTDNPRPPVQTHPGALESRVFPEWISEGLTSLSRQEGVTPFVTVLAAFKTLLYKYANQTDVVVGTPVANRTRFETEGLIGCFLNTLALRTDLSGNPTFRQLLRQVQAVTLGAHEHQDLPFELLIETLSTERNISYAPVFQVLFLYQNKSLENLNQRDLSLTPIDIHSGTAKFDLALSVVEGTNGHLTASLEYNTDLFNAQTITWMLAHFETLLAAIVSDPEQHLHDLNLLAEAEQEQILFKWNATQTEFTETPCLHKLFEEQAARTPEAVALMFGSDSLTYQQLNERANQLAHHLRSLGVGTESVVALLMDRSLEMVISLFAVLKAGGAYLPLDPTYPPQRLSFMLSDAQPVVLLRQRGQRGTLTVPPGMTVLEVEEQKKTAVSAESVSESYANPEVEVGAANLAYVIYTSGSTGQPKGAMITHGAITNRLLWMQQQYQLDASDVVLQKTPFTFDVSVWEFFWPLITGARLVVARPGGHQDTRYLLELIRSRQITTLHFVPSMLQAFLAEAGVTQGCRKLRRVICSGEALVPELVRRYYEQLTAPLENLYGPTEAAVDVTRWGCDAEAVTPGGVSVPIGRPIANIQMYVLDEGMGCVPVGVSGELYIGGVGLARGYRGRAELTAEKFVPNPHTLEAGARLYRTGDVGRYLATGELEYQGRVDYQVKIRGYRIELGEIEAVLRQHAAITDAVVVPRQNALGEKQLVGYVVIADGADTAAGSEITSAALRKYIGARLPHYMIPAILVKLDEMPLSANGKIDRQRLPAIETKVVKTEPAAPANPIEEKLLAIWTQVLRIDQMSVDDNFFALGGDSIRIVQIVSQAQYKGLHFEAQLIYQHQTIRDLAREIEKAAQQADTVQEEAGGEEDAETLARLMEMLEGLSDADVKERIEEKTGSSLERIIQ
jgi:amino acid adenylation domain-containing protein